MFLTVVIVFLTTSPVYAEPSSSNSSASSMTSSMIGFFNKGTQLDTDKISGNELAVYGVFLSNFIIPGINNVEDLTSDEVCTKIANNFFGGSQVETVKKLNATVQNVITEDLGNSANTPKIWGMDLTGKTLMSGMKNVTTSSPDGAKITLNGKDFLDLSSNAVNAMWTTIYGINPMFFFDSSTSTGRGLFTLATIRVDAFGNIWGAYMNDNLDPKKFTLIVPACLNPYLFDGKYPVQNAFSTGAMIGINSNDGENDKIIDGTASTVAAFKQKLGSSVDVTPFMSYLGLSLYGKNKDNYLSIYGINTPSKYFTNLNNKGTDSSVSNVDAMVKEDKNKPSTGSTEYLIVAINTNMWLAHEEKSTWGGKEYLLEQFQESAGSTEERKKSIEYLTRSSVLDLNNEVSHEFHWFNFNSDSIASAINKNTMADIELEDFVKPVSIFKSDDTYTSSRVSPLLYALGEGSEQGFNTKMSPVGDKIKIAEDGDSGINLTGGKSISSSVLYNNIMSGKDVYISKQGGSSSGIVGSSYEAGFSSSALLWLGHTPTKRGSVDTAADNVPVIIATGPHSYTTVDDYINGATALVKMEDLYALSIWKSFSCNDSALGAFSGTDANVKATYKYVDTNGEGTRDYWLQTSVANEGNLWANIYWTYLVKLLKVSDINSVGGFNFDALPQNSLLSSNNTTSLADVIASVDDGKSEGSNSYEEKQKKLLDTIEALLDPEPNETRNEIFRGIINGFLVDTHKAITGSRNSSTATSGVSVDTTNSYSSVVGYISSPSLRDLPFTSWVIDNYLYIYLFLLLVVTMSLIMMVISNVRTWRQGAVMFIIMAFALILPQSLLNNAVVIGNKFSDAMFSDRFTYWAVTEHEMSLQAKQAASAQGSETQMIQDNIDRSVIAYQDDKTGVRLKWMSPKKNDIFTSLYSDVLTDSALGNNLTLFKWLFSSFFTGDEYVTNDPFATYVYRVYTDIANDAKSYYTNAKTLGISIPDIRRNVMTRVSSNARITPENLKFIGADYYTDCTGYALNGTKRDIYGNTDFSDSSPFNVHTGYGFPQAHLIYNVKSRDMSDVNNTAMTKGIGNSYQEPVDVTTFTNGGFEHRYWHLVSESVLDSVFTKDPSVEANPGIEVSADDASLQMYIAYTESPYYYFYNVLKNRFSKTAAGAVNFKTALMTDSSYIYAQDDLVSNGDLRDFLDLEGLFTTVIPVLYEGNMYVKTYTDNFGRDIETFNFEGYEDRNEGDPSLTAEFYASKEKKDNLRKVWNMYCPWVDYMYELKLVNEKVSYAGERMTILDGLNPGSYDEVGRPMVYSEADMSAKHMKYSDLTDAERRIQNVLEDTYKDMLYALNYYDFSEETLLSFCAMSATFNFNKEFSGSALLGNNGVIYPQSFNLKNFNYDAFLRLTLMNATGIPLSNTEEDMYEIILDKTSWWTGVIIIIEDILAVYVIPASKTIIMLLLLFLGLIFCVSCVVSPPDKVLKSLGSAILVPTLIYMLLNMAFSLVIALFMGEGLTSYVGSKTANISLNDPTVTVLLLILISGVYAWLLFRLIKMLFGTFKNYGIGAILGVMAVATSAGSIITSKAKALARTGRTTFIAGRFGKSNKYVPNSGADNKSNLPDNSSNSKDTSVKETKVSRHRNKADSTGNTTGNTKDISQAVEQKASEYKFNIGNIKKDGLKTAWGKRKITKTYKKKYDEVDRKSVDKFEQKAQKYGWTDEDREIRNKKARDEIKAAKEAKAKAKQEAKELKERQNAKALRKHIDALNVERRKTLGREMNEARKDRGTSKYAEERYQEINRRYKAAARAVDKQRDDWRKERGEVIKPRKDESQTQPSSASKKRKVMHKKHQINKSKKK